MRAVLSRRTTILLLLNLACLSFLIHLYVLIRFDFLWESGDAVLFTRIIQSTQASGSLTGTVVYPYGFGYQAISVFLSETTSLSVADLQLYLYPILGTLPTLIIYPVAKRLTDDVWIAILAAFLFGTQSDVLFTTFRSTHEKFTWVLILAVLLLFILATTKRSRPRDLLTTIGITLALYLALFALVSLNLFFASSFLIILIIGLAVTIAHSRGVEPRSLRRLGYVCVSGVVLFFAFILYVYPPAIAYLEGLTGFGQLIFVALFNLEQQSTPQYQYAVQSWSSIYVWALLTAETWLILGVSAYPVLRLVGRRRSQSADGFSPLFMNLFVGALGMLGIGVIADRFGRFSSNLELRLIPVVMVFAVPIAARELMKWVRSPRSPLMFTKVAVLILSLVMVTPLSVLKASVDPGVSNVRSYVTPGEKAAIVWILSTNLNGSVWSDPDGRVASEAGFFAPFSTFPNWTYKFFLSGRVNYYFTSSITDALYSEQLKSIENATDSLIYSQGDAEIYLRSANYTG